MSTSNKSSAECLELGNRTPATSSRTPQHASAPELVRNELALIPVDGGLGAWSFVQSGLTNANLKEMIVYGFPMAFGVFLAEYLRNPEYLAQPGATSLLPLIGSLSSGIINFSAGLFIYPFISRNPEWRRTLTLIGGIICFASILGASYATKVTQLLALQGILYAIGGSLLYAPCISYIPEWFVKKRGLANGVMFAGMGVGGLILPLIIPRIIAVHGSAITLRYLSIAIGILLLPCYPFLKGRLPVARIDGSAARRPSDHTWLTSTSFWLVIAVNTVQSFGYFLPVLWLPTFASNLDLSDSDSSLTLAALNGASVIGGLAIGYVSDTVDPWLLALSTLGSSALATFVLWGFLSNSFPGVLAFSLVYGIMTGAWPSLWTAFLRPIVKDDLTLATSLFGYILLSRGIGNIASTPISNVLMRNNQSSVPHQHTKTGFAVGEGRFENVILYVSICFATASVMATIGWGREKSRARKASSNA
ncbi:MFS general substrate transporter [Athelia psychrophila]|uniref:MFS general substrate transporter n=1 Tax=Athelia psychrophila TaxID=1759441 RepID=A0A167VTH7_9AGAM|nr:MFS general substrate transporter [Fibularhizoctonia sp. CBS 109695]